MNYNNKTAVRLRWTTVNYKLEWSFRSSYCIKQKDLHTHNNHYNVEEISLQP